MNSTGFFVTIPSPPLASVACGCMSYFLPFAHPPRRQPPPQNQATKAELPRRFLDRLQLHHAILLPGNAHPFVGRGGIPSVSIDVEKRQGNRLERSFLHSRVFFFDTHVVSYRT